MKRKLSKTEAKEKIDKFFQREDFSAEEVKKIKRLAMKFNLKLGEKRKLFCKKCLSRLRGKLRVSKTHKTIECGSCGQVNRHKY
jgi:RNase P subunit RPR2